MNILIPIRFELMRNGGVGHYTQSLIRYASDTCRFYDLSGKHYAARVRFDDTAWVRRSKRRLWVAFDLMVFPRKKLRAKIDLVHLAPSLVPNAMVRDMRYAEKCIKADLPFVIFFHGWRKEYEAYLESSPRRLERVVGTLGQAGKLVVLASGFRNKLVEWGVDEKKIVVETTGVDDRLLEGYTIEERLGRSGGGRINILFLSRVEKAKGIYEAIDAYRIVRSKYPNATMTIAGDGTELPKAIEYVKREDIAGIQCLGWVDGETKRRAFADADIYLFPSWGEGMPTSVLEAMAYGLPVVTRPVGGLVDFFQHGRMGFVTDSKRPEVLAAFCETLIQDGALRKQMAVFNHEYARQRFLASQVAKRMQAIYTEVIEAYRRAHSV